MRSAYFMMMLLMDIFGFLPRTRAFFCEVNVHIHNRVSLLDLSRQRIRNSGRQYRKLYTDPQFTWIRPNLRHFTTTASLSSTTKSSDLASYPYSVITSLKSQTVKKFQALLNKRKKRVEFQQTVVEGPRMIFDLLDNPKTASLIRQVVVSLPDFEERADYRIKLEDAPSKLHDNDKQNLLIQLATPQVFQSCCDTMTPQGIVAIVDIPSCEEVEEKSSNESTAKSSAALHLVLDGVSDPGNVGTLLRSSLAVGVKSVMLLPGCCDVWNPKAVRSGMGASFQLPLFSCDDWENGMTVMDKLGVKAIYVATMLDDVDDFNASAATHHGANPKGSVAYHQVDWSKENSALVIGSEGNGLSHQVRQALMTKAINGENGIPIKATHIPMEAGIESLNAAVCGSVILFEYARQQAKTQSE